MTPETVGRRSHRLTAAVASLRRYTMPSHSGALGLLHRGGGTLQSDPNHWGAVTFE